MNGPYFSSGAWVTFISCLILAVVVIGYIVLWFTRHD